MRGSPPTPPHQASLPEVGTVAAGVQGKGVPGMGEGSAGLPDDGEQEKHIQGPLRGPARGPAPQAYALPTVLRVLITLPLNVCYKWSLMPRSWSRAQSSCPPFLCLSVALSSAGWRPRPHQSYIHTHTQAQPRLTPAPVGPGVQGGSGTVTHAPGCLRVGHGGGGPYPALAAARHVL